MFGVPIESMMLYATVAMATFTFIAVVVALFGDALRSLMFRADLKIELRSIFGDKTESKVFSKEYPEGRRIPSRYYHLIVSNKSRVSKATQTQVYLTRVETPGPDGELLIRWDSEIPLQWSHQEINPLTRTVGPDAWVDLFSIVKEKWLLLHPVIIPFSLQPLIRHEAGNSCHLVLSVQARSADGVSKTHRFAIIWDGEWSDGEKEMGGHVIVKEV